MLDGMRLFGMGWSWGGFESLMIPTWPERARTVTRWNPGGPSLRVHIGLEDPQDSDRAISTKASRDCAADGPVRPLPLRALNHSASAGARIFCALPPTNVPMCPPGTATSV